ncbi:MAG: hypothetical protein ACMG6E_03070, partial [Candidatus Roizmanbacteria bacterium]
HGWRTLLTHAEALLSLNQEHRGATVSDFMLERNKAVAIILRGILSHTGAPLGTLSMADEAVERDVSAAASLSQIGD